MSHRSRERRGKTQDSRLYRQGSDHFLPFAPNIGGDGARHQPAPSPRWLDEAQLPSSGGTTGPTPEGLVTKLR